jgi:hypothetical protein
MKNEAPEPKMQLEFKKLAGLPAVAKFGHAHAPETHMGTKWQRLEPNWIKVEIPHDWRYDEYRVPLPIVEDCSIELARNPITMSEQPFVVLKRHQYMIRGLRRGLWIGKTQAPGVAIGTFEVTLYWAVQ